MRTLPSRGAALALIAALTLTAPPLQAHAGESERVETPWLVPPTPDPTLDRQAEELVAASTFEDDRSDAERRASERRRLARDRQAERDEILGEPLLSTLPGVLEPMPPFFENGVLMQQVTVIGRDERLRLIDPIYRALPMKGFGVPSGGSSGSPSFDPVTGQYWWQ